VSQPVIYILNFTVIIQVEDLTYIGADPEVEAAHSERAASFCDSRVGRAHVTRHPSAAGEIVPLGQFFDHAVTAPLPGETIRAGRRFLANGRLIEVDLDFLSDEMQGGFVHNHMETGFQGLFAMEG